MTKNSNQGGPALSLGWHVLRQKKKKFQSVLKYDISTVRKFVTLQHCNHSMRKISYTSIRELCQTKKIRTARASAQSTNYNTKYKL